ncbi:hypothetical protein [Blastococcus brunescens]|uniref:MFS transporter n=1 Tax=Blastococcus brunescens TaxID=1564165 RepID=A0ABZ1B7G6_9ACTN|nr:hypothetical protein [Blastococcus sp. BMG 8361]WRL66757.1 hypothetical protein U6N30_16045 [Blastococcus sp. BMG 8361]
MLVDEVGLTLRAASVAASVFQVLGIPGALLVPLVLGRLRAQRGLALVVATSWGLVPLGMLLQPGLWAVWVGVGGLVQGAGVSLAFALVAVRGADEDAVGRLSAMTQLVGYSVGAAGPLVVGALLAAGGGWSGPFGLLVLVATVYAAAGWVAGRPVQVGG